MISSLFYGRSLVWVRSALVYVCLAGLLGCESGETVRIDFVMPDAAIQEARSKVLQVAEPMEYKIGYESSGKNDNNSERNLSFLIGKTDQNGRMYQVVNVSIANNGKDNKISMYASEFGNLPPFTVRDLCAFYKKLSSDVMGVTNITYKSNVLKEPCDGNR